MGKQKGAGVQTETREGFWRKAEYPTQQTDRRYYPSLSVRWSPLITHLQLQLVHLPV